MRRTDASAGAYPLRAGGLTVTLAQRDLGPFDLLVGPGELVALTGINGSGKTTLIRLALGIDRATSGRSEVFGRQVTPLHPPVGVGYVPDRAEFWDWRSGRENLRAFARSDRGADELLERFALTAAAKQSVRRYSRGMRQRLSIARALATEPKLLVMDEPTIALDVRGVDLLVEVLIERRERRAATLVASHDGDFLDRLDCRRMLVADGRTLR